MRQRAARYFFLALFIFSWPAQAALGGDPHVVTIDTAQYRELVMGVDAISFPIELAKTIPQVDVVRELSRLLDFTALFKSVSSLASADAQGVTTAPATTTTVLTPPAATSTTPASQGVVLPPDLIAWKQAGADALIRGSVSKVGKGFVIDFKVWDFLRGRNVLAESYAFGDANDYQTQLKRFVDVLIQTYTGKAGLFQSQIVFAGRETKSSPKQIYICDPEGKNLQRLTHDPVIHTAPAIDPTGRKVVFTSYRNGYPNLYMLDLKNPKKHELLAGGHMMNMGGSFTPDGKFLAFSRSTNGSTEIVVQNLATKQLIPLIRGDGIFVEPRFSKDATSIVYSSGQYGNPHVYRADIAWEGSTVRLTSSPVRLTFSGWYNSTPAWTPDDKGVTFAGFDRDIGRFDIFTMTREGQKLERLTLQNGNNESPSYSPHGRLIAFQSNRSLSGEKGPYQLYIMRADGTRQMRLDIGLYEASLPFWGPYVP